METSEIECNLLSIGEPKLHDAMCKTLCGLYVKILALFPDLEAARPRSTSGIQALCSLHIALEKTKTILRHCAECSKLYLAITGDSVVLKFEKARRGLVDSLTRVQDIVPQTIGHQIAEIIGELAKTEFSLDPVDKKIGGDIILLFQQGRNSNINKIEFGSFHEVACKLGITSSLASLQETRALKKLIERAQADEDKRKESIIAFLLHLMRKYSKLFKSELSDDNDSQGSTPCSPTVHNMIGFSNFKPNTPIPPEELRCPISLQLMYDPVIISSGQTYERVCIEKWFAEGHNTCPKTQQQLSHLSLTPNFCVKGLVASWCEQNGVSIQDKPNLNYWRLVLSESDSANSKSIGSIGSCKFNVEETVCAREYDCEVSAFERYEIYLTVLEKEDDMMKKCKVVEQIRHLLRDDEEARVYMGANGFVEPLLCFLESAVFARDGKAQEIGAMAIFNLAVNNNRNKELMLASGVLQILHKMIANTDSVKSATALYMNLSSLEEAKPVIGTSEVVPFLISILIQDNDVQCQLDALHTLYNISSHPPNIPHLLSAGIVNALQTIITPCPNNDQTTEKCLAILIHLSSNKTAIDEITMSVGLISGLAAILDVGEPYEQEQSAACLVALCDENEKCSQLVLREGVIPSLVSISVNGTARGRQKAQTLLMLFREQRQQRTSESGDMALSGQYSKPLCKTASNGKLGKGLSFWLKNKSFSLYQC